ncbi:HyaD/HybD family hydrogenase maturation endopeptidase [Roseicyclus persicicus]|uniref:Hydrogenase expression/formation protein HupD n=1 Tax=Roseicyclus persicicus TaxID=2650661 RepID=A0A7X6H0V8_9RHOB|nr:HyaD/HybD family hydrogenase maturation endopeptidase [Roseibacterium persicicum]NKX45977.1 HyaD/HybD family hydrogenase maturation endopeptidase [Roseibacterium persicicum]
MTDRTLILGIGNLLWADEGFGVRCVERLAERAGFGPEVQIMDGGTQGLYLLPFLEDARNLLVFDAVDYGLPPGMMKVVENEAVPAFMGAKKMSLHQTGFQDVIATAQLKGICPDRLCLIGVQPEELEDYGGGLRPIVAAQIDPAVDRGLDKLAQWGVHPTGPGTGSPDLADVALRRDAYEGGRPSEDMAYRHGDERFVPGRRR